ncbi:response regulator transcription factor [Bacteroides sp. OF04-15BH]|jgi:two-component system alkaline phosphatase synthesis response regulator PhoP|uniref:response regulator transcription factor n=1 Tax=Bacteroides sp. OF04-15BH TaxID=2292281 RepID=UPI000E4E3EB0|nr:response regulator transcription factor [Bacteroides sp. OF04-15BH]RHP66479.1 DNA-binding response regulator [Bacteroides sp. OF04-15BH]
MNDYKILVVDDEEDLCDILRFNLENEGYNVDIAYSAEEALKLDLTQYHLILLDVMMGEISGFRMAKMLKESKNLNHIPIIFLTARDTENDAVTGFTLGADDYISKPFSLREVVLRVKAVLRRTSPKAVPQASLIGYKDLKINMKLKEAILHGEVLQLTKTEFELLRLFIENEGRVFSRAEILRKIWHDDAEVLDRTIDVNITRLRKKLGDYGKYIMTRQGYGYYFEAGAKE